MTRSGQLAVADPGRGAAGESSRAYWLCQELGWGGYTLLYFLLVLVPLRQATLRSAAADLAYGLAALCGTHLLRSRMRRGQWTDLSPARLIPRLAAGVILAGLFQTVVLEAALTLERQIDWHRTSQVLAVILSIAASSVTLDGLWLAVYLVVQSARRRRAVQMQSLRAEVLARDAQLRSLQQQLNPHFLFNCLNSLRGMIGEDRARAQEMVTRLAELLRASLRQDESNAISLEDELATVNAYLDLESVRLEERLCIRREIDPALHAALIPPMLLQGMVENALKHGIARLASGGDLVLRIARHGEQLLVEVENSGTLSAPDGNGIGLANARERLRLLYGPNAALTLTQSSPEIVRATVTLPLQTAEDLCALSS